MRNKVFESQLRSRARSLPKLGACLGACQCYYYMLFTIHFKFAIFMAQFMYNMMTLVQENSSKYWHTLAVLDRVNCQYLVISPS